MGTKQWEFDHPSGEANVYAAYEGTGGVPVGNLLRRLVLATLRDAANPDLFLVAGHRHKRRDSAA